MRKRILAVLLIMAACFLAGCEMQTVEQMYCLPKRPESYNDLQSVIDEAMEDMEYSAPRAGENQQTVQMADLDGDGVREYLLFAKSDGEKPLRILIFAQSDESYVLLDTIQCYGTSFDVVEYAQMDGEGGMEILVGRKLNDQVPGSVSVYTFTQGQMQQVLSAKYTKFLTCDMDDDTCSELMVLRPGMTEGDDAVAELYSVKSGTAQRSNEVKLSCPADKLKHIVQGRLYGGTPSVFVGSSMEENAIVTDALALIDDVFTNVSSFNKTGTKVPTLRNYYVYADDIDDDGVVELPSLITMRPLQQEESSSGQYLIRWYAMSEDGSETDKLYTYHDFVGGWYLELEQLWTHRISVAQDGNDYYFYLWDDQYAAAGKIFSIHMLSGQNREEQAVLDNRFVVYKSDSVIFAARLEVASGALSITQDDLINYFHLIRQDWNTGEM